MRLPEHCFYVDNLYSFEPLIHVDSLVYINKDLYLYTIGRERQSISNKVIMTGVLEPSSDTAATVADYVS